jgi:hypothetical protein
VADNELDRAGQRRFVEAFAATMHADAGSRKKGYVTAAVAAVVISAGAAVAVGAVSSHKSATVTDSARLSALGRTASPRTTVASSASTAGTQGPVRGTAVKHSAAGGAVSGHATQQGGAGPVVVLPATGGDAAVQSSSSSAGTGTASTGTSAPSSEAAAPAKTTAPAKAAVVTTASFKVTGQISCTSGNSVEGVWVQASDGAGYAAWKGLGNGSTSNWWFTLIKQESYSLHVGCGGTTSSWAVATYSPTVTGAHNSFNCFDVAGDANYGTCISR